MRMPVKSKGKGDSYSHLVFLGILPNGEYMYALSDDPDDPETYDIN